MKLFRAGLPEIDTDDGTVGPPPSVPVRQVLEFTRTRTTGSPLVNGDAPADAVPHSINAKPEVEA